jgi:hypothetical protein
MKHILNNLSEQEKNAIREQHIGGMNVVTENFHKLLGSKLGDSKPLTEQTSMSSMFTNAANALTGQGKPAPQNKTGNDRISNLANMLRSLQVKQVPQKVIVAPGSQLDGMIWNDYLKQFKITKEELRQANTLLSKLGVNPQSGGAKPTSATTGTTTQKPGPGGGVKPTSATTGTTTTQKPGPGGGVKPTGGASLTQEGSPGQTFPQQRPAPRPTGGTQKTNSQTVGNPVKPTGGAPITQKGNPGQTFPQQRPAPRPTR